MDQGIIVRPMVPSDLKNAMDLAISEGWNQTEKDWNLLLDDESNRYLVALDKGKVIGTITSLNYAKNLMAWLGMLLINKEYRGQGIGRLMMTSIIETVKEYQSIKLDATPAGRPLYLKLGFFDEFLIYRMVCPSFEGRAEMHDPEVIPLNSEDLDAVISFDRDIFGLGRTYLLTTIRNNYPEKAFVLKRNGKVAGYVLGRDGMRFNYIGPVFAHSTGDAIKLISGALTSVKKDSAIAIDVPEDKKELIKWLEQNGFSVQRNFTRMYLEKNPFPGNPGNQYLISGPEFG